MSSHAELHVLRDTIAEKLVGKTDDLTTDNANKWLACCEDKKKQFMTDDEIVDVMTREEKRKRRKTEKQRQLFT